MFAQDLIALAHLVAEREEYPREEFEAGTDLGRYRIIRLLAYGGMAEIYLANVKGAHGFEKPVVIKRIPPHLADNDDLVTMFLDEARLAAKLHHPNIGQVYDIGADPETCYYAMEYIEGRDLRHILSTSRKRNVTIPVEHAIGIVMAVASALHAAHNHRNLHGEPLGLVHRDVSPANVVVSYDGIVKLIDFGIAKAAHRQTMTKTGVIKGKYSYMSPEQCRGAPVDHRSDIFSLGILLWELTTGHKLFYGGSDYQVMRRVIKDPIPRPSKVCPGYSEVLEGVVMKALARDPRERYQTALELYRDLEAVVRAYHLFASQYDIADFMRALFPEQAPPPVAWPSGSNSNHNTNLIDSSVFEIDMVTEQASKSPATVRLQVAPTNGGSVVAFPAPQTSSALVPLPINSRIGSAPEEIIVETTEPVARAPRSAVGAVFRFLMVIALFASLWLLSSGDIPGVQPVTDAPPAGLLGD